MAFNNALPVDLWMKMVASEKQQQENKMKDWVTSSGINNNKRVPEEQNTEDEAYKVTKVTVKKTKKGKVKKNDKD